MKPSRIPMLQFFDLYCIDHKHFKKAMLPIVINNTIGSILINTLNPNCPFRIKQMLAKSKYMPIGSICFNAALMLDDTICFEFTLWYTQRLYPFAFTRNMSFIAAIFCSVLPSSSI